MCKGVKDIEEYVKKVYKVNKINVCAWQQYGNHEVIEFYQKNGFKLLNHKNMIYDDSCNIFDLYVLEKKL